LNTFTYYVNAIVNPPNSTGYIPPSSWASIALEVRAQCDGADGVVDGAILEPGKCFLNYDAFRCGGNSTFLNETTCLSDEQLQTYKTIYTNLTDPDTQELLFPAFNVGSEFLWAASVNGV
jgi:feruloyl esterase